MKGGEIVYWRWLYGYFRNFGLQLVLSLIVYALIAKWYVAPWLAEKPIHRALMPLIFPHAFRHIGLTFFVPGVVAQPLPSFFATTVAYGDFISGLLALLALVALRGGWGLALGRKTAQCGDGGQTSRTGSSEHLSYGQGVASKQVAYNRRGDCLLEVVLWIL